MKPKNLLNLLALGTALTITAVGCKTGPQNAKRIPGTPQPVADTGPLDRTPHFNQLPQPRGQDQNPPGIPPNDTVHDNWPAHPEILQAQTIHFDFDKASVKTADQSKLEAVANYLKANPANVVRIEGNCDERGTEEYNRSLGERRALAAREYLVRLGIPPQRIDTISYGEDKPAETGHAEAAWAKNRRDDFVVLTPPGRF
jgi:peptidoglycan-associated lipoprotein